MFVSTENHLTNSITINFENSEASRNENGLCNKCLQIPTNIFYDKRLTDFMLRTLTRQDVCSHNYYSIKPLAVLAGVL